MPERVQLRRTKGWRLPPNTVVVSRPSRWGNPFKARPVPGWPSWGGPPPWQVVARDGTVWDVEHGDDVHTTRAAAIAAHRLEAARLAVDLFELHIGPMGNYELDNMEVLEPLRGKNLACWCRIDDPCHADVLLDLANEPDLTLSPSVVR